MQCIQAVNSRETPPLLGLNGREKWTPRAEKGAGWGGPHDKADLIVTGSLPEGPEGEVARRTNTFLALPMNLWISCQCLPTE